MGRTGRRRSDEGPSGRASHHDLVLKITGGAPLAGDLCVSGSKNAALPEMAAALLTDEPVHLKNVPRVTDTQVMARVLESIGAKCEGEGRSPSTPAARRRRVCRTTWASACARRSCCWVR